MPPVHDFQCRICANTAATHHCTVKDDTSRNTGLIFDYVCCSQCGTLSLHPLPTPEQTDLANQSLLGITRPNSSFDKRYTDAYRQALRNEYRMTLQDIGAPIEPPFKGATCFDFGCAIGCALDLLADSGWQTYGCDVSRQLTALADHNRHNIHVGTLDTLPAEWNGFDMVITIEVLEHLPDPVAALNKLVSMLKPGGILVTETPQVGTLSALYGNNWRVLAGLDHIHLMTRETQFKLIEAAGCTVQAWSSFGSGCTSGITPPHIKKAFDTLVKQQGIGDFLAIKAIKN